MPKLHGNKIYISKPTLASTTNPYNNIRCLLLNKNKLKKKKKKTNVMLTSV